jgi:hypothetical protein
LDGGADSCKAETMPDCLPTFLGIGAVKSGTTAVHQFLLAHPQVFLPAIKELRFFSQEGLQIEYREPGRKRIPRGIKSWEEYKAVFRHAGKYAVRGEISPQYMMLAENAAANIFRRLPDVKLFAVLRNPVDRAYSNYLQAVRLGKEPLLDFREALSRESERIRGRWPPLFWYKHNGLYHRQLAEYFSRFPQGRIRILFSDDLRRDAAGFMADLYRYLGADPEYKPDTSMKFNPGGLPRHLVFYRWMLWMRYRTRFLDGVLPVALRYPLLSALRNGLLRPAPPMPDEVRLELIEYYREDILELQNLVDRDLSDWLKPNGSSSPERGPLRRDAR